MSRAQNEVARTFGLLDEYKALREEMMWHMDQGQKSLTHFLLLVSALIGYGVAQDSPLLFVIGWLINLEYWRLYIAQRGYVAKISRYIVSFVEPHVPGVKWEGRVQHAEVIAADRGIQTWQGRRVRFFRTLLGPHSVLALACLVLTVFLGLRPEFALTAIVTALLVVAAVLLHVTLVWRYLTPSFSDLRKTWDDVWFEVQRRERAPHDDETSTTRASA